MKRKEVTSGNSGIWYTVFVALQWVPINLVNDTRPRGVLVASHGCAKARRLNLLNGNDPRSSHGTTADSTFPTGTTESLPCHHDSFHQ
mmetsp:Transcript_520/g.1224  ORF Transcript_520/g.1224 Transcript_520/m.1224 type:complete len:88 (+) Transcript_520:1105-1368(+)